MFSIFASRLFLSAFFPSHFIPLPSSITICFRTSSSFLSKSFYSLCLCYMFVRQTALYHELHKRLPIGATAYDSFSPEDSRFCCWTLTIAKAGIKCISLLVSFGFLPYFFFKLERYSISVRRYDSIYIKSQSFMDLLDFTSSMTQ